MPSFKEPLSIDYLIKVMKPFTLNSTKVVRRYIVSNDDFDWMKQSADVDEDFDRAERFYQHYAYTAAITLDKSEFLPSGIAACEYVDGEIRFMRLYET